MAQVQDGDTVKVHYTGRLSDGTVFDSSLERDPLQFQLGASQVIPGFEQAVVGLSPGEKVTTEIPAAAAYGDHMADRIVTVNREDLPPDYTPEVGHQLQSQQGDGRSIMAVINEVTDTLVKLDMNHPLAGKDLIFDIELVEIG